MPQPPASAGTVRCPTKPVSLHSYANARKQQQRQVNVRSTYPAAATTDIVEGSKPISVHDHELYGAVAAELPADEPVLHSVVHTHNVLVNRRLRNIRPDKIAAAEAGGRPASAPTTSPTLDERTAHLKAEIDKMNDDLHVWKVQRYCEHMTVEEQAAAEARLEFEMKQRLAEKRCAEQDRALRRIQRIVDSVGPKLAASIERNSAALDQDVQDDAQRKIAEKDSAANHLPLTSESRVELARHDQQREERLQHRIKEMNDFTHSWLVERELYNRYEMRASYGRQHALEGHAIVDEEQVARRDLLRRLLDMRTAALFQEDESDFRSRLYTSEENSRGELLDYMMMTVGHHPASDEDDEESESEEDDDEEAAEGEEADGMMHSGNHPHDPIEHGEPQEGVIGNSHPTLPHSPLSVQQKEEEAGGQKHSDDQPHDPIEHGEPQEGVIGNSQPTLPHSPQFVQHSEEEEKGGQKHSDDQPHDPIEHGEPREVVIGNSQPTLPHSPQSEQQNEEEVDGMMHSGNQPHDPIEHGEPQEGVIGNSQPTLPHSPRSEQHNEEEAGVHITATSSPERPYESTEPAEAIIGGSHATLLTQYSMAGPHGDAGGASPLLLRSPTPAGSAVGDEESTAE